MNPLYAKKVGNRLFKGMQEVSAKARKASAQARERMIKNYESERAKLLAIRRAEMSEVYAENENLLYAGERKKMELKKRREIGKAMSYLMEKGYPSVKANALATAFGFELYQMKKELSSQLGDVRTKKILQEMRFRLLSIFDESYNMNLLIKDVRTQEKQFSQSILNQVKEEVFQRNGIPVD